VLTGKFIAFIIYALHAILT